LKHIFGIQISDSYTYILTMACTQMTLEEKWQSDKQSDKQSEASFMQIDSVQEHPVQTNLSMFNPLACTQLTLNKQSEKQTEESQKQLECYIKREGEDWMVASRHHICAYIMYDSIPIKEQKQRIVTPHLQGGYFVAKFSETDVPHEYVYVDEYDRRVEIKMDYVM